MTPLLAVLAAATALDLEQAVELARAAASEAVIAREDVVLVDADYLQALSAVLPRVDLTVQAGEVFSGDNVLESRERAVRAGTSMPVDVDDLVLSYGPFRDFRASAMSNPQLGLQLQVSQLVFDGGRWWTQLARVEDVARAREAALERVLAELRLSVARAFYGHEAAREAEQVVRAQVAADQAQLERARALLDAGRAKPADVAAAVRNSALDRSELARKGVQLKQAARRLNLLLGRAPSSPVELRVSPSAAPALMAKDALVERALRSRPELAALDAERAAADKAVTIAEAGYYPAVSLGANYRRQSRRVDRVFGDPTENYTAGVDLTVRWNLFEGRATEAQVAQAEGALRKVEARRGELLRSVEAEVLDAIDALALQAELAALAAEATGAAEEALRLARGLYDEGRGTLLEVRDAELQVLQAKLNGITAHLEAEIAREGLARALGTVPSKLSSE